MGIFKKCGKCKIEKDENEFNKNKNKKSGTSSVCKLCHKEYRRLHYLKNKEKVLDQVNSYRIENNLNKIYSKKTEELRLKFPNITFNHVKAGRTSPINCCFCGVEYFKRKTDIKDKNFCSVSCRNSEKEVNYLKNYLSSIKKRAIKKNIEFDLEEDYLNQLFKIQSGLCGITNVPIKIPTRIETKIYETASLDRIDSSSGYIKGNVMWVVLGINYMKNRHSNEDLKELIDRIFEYRKK
jgi:hypothetical protein